MLMVFFTITLIFHKQNSDLVNWFSLLNLAKNILIFQIGIVEL